MISLYHILYHVIKMYPYFHYILYMYFLCKSFFMKNVAETNKWNENELEGMKRILQNLIIHVNMKHAKMAV